MGRSARLGAVVSWLIVLVLALVQFGTSESVPGIWLRDLSASALLELRGTRPDSDHFAVLELGEAAAAPAQISAATVSTGYAEAVRLLAGTGAAGIVIVTPLPPVAQVPEGAARLSTQEAELTRSAYRLLADAIEEARTTQACPVFLAGGETGSAARPASELLAALERPEIMLGLDPLTVAQPPRTTMPACDALYVASDGATSPTLPWLAARFARTGKLPEVDTLPVPRRGEAGGGLINYVGPTGALPVVEYSKLRRAESQELERLRELWDGRIVFLGWRGLPDGPFAVPYWLLTDAGEMYRAELLANLADTLATDRVVHQLPQLVLTGLTLLCLVLSTLGIIRLTSGYSLLIDLVIAAAVVGGAWWLFQHDQLLPAGVVLAALVLSGIMVRSVWADIAMRESFGLQRQARQVLHERETLLRAVLDTNPAYMHVRDAEGRVRLANQRFAALFAARPEQVVGQTLSSLCASVGRQPADPRRWLTEDTDVIEQQRFITTLERIDSPEGSLWYQTSKMPLSAGDGRRLVLVISEDVTQLKRTEEELRQEHNLLEGVFTSLPELVFAVDRDLRLINANPAYLEQIGAEDAAGVTGTEERLFHHAEHCRRPETACPACRVFATGAAHREDRTLKGEDRAERQLEITATPLLDAEGRPQGVVQVARDVTARRSMERQLRVSQKLEAIGTLAGGIAHDFNNILTGIIGYTEMAVAEAPRDSEQRDFLEEVLRASQRASELVRQILVFSRRSEAERRPVKLQPLIKEVLFLLRASLPATITIKQDIDPAAGSVMADLTQMHQVIMNLCTNASHAMTGSDESLSVALDEVDVDEELAAELLGLNAGRYVRLTVSDTGTGIPAEIRDRIFEPFFTTKEPEIGTGMGLATVHGIIAETNGVITVDSEEGVGSTFSVYLPRAAAADAEGEDRPAVEPRGPGRVLVVEDEPALAELMAGRLRAWGFEVEHFTDSPAALEAFRADPQRFDLVITDQTMPRLTGAEMAAQLLQIRPGMPVVLCTGFSGAVSSEQAHQLGICEFLMKPITTRTLAEAVSRALSTV